MWVIAPVQKKQRRYIFKKQTNARKTQLKEQLCEKNENEVLFYKFSIVPNPK